MDKADMLKEKIADADFVLVGIGEEFASRFDCDDEDVIRQEKEDAIKAYNMLARLLEGKNYYINSICIDGYIRESKLDMSRVVELCADYENEESGEDAPTKDWDRYTKWLTGTLNRKLCILELGVGMNLPNLIRWPFEKIAFYNQKASFFRINETLYQMTEEIGDKGVSIEGNALRFLIEME